ncbi:MAG TPA: sigma-E factor regulatory protein RseB domain-containing protein [Vicinamibacterales bacterium]|nr:sigma-E factor regulatory protein RseB domain-containing protein [Vicinamibacterales bacterium]
MPVAVRLPIDVTDPASVSAFDARVAALRDPAVRLWVVSRIPADAAAVDGWRRALRAFFTSRRSRVAVCELSLGSEPTDVMALAIRTAATELRAAVEQAQLAIAVPEDGPARLSTLVDRDLAAYVDVIAAPTEDIVNAALGAVERTAPSVHGAVTGLVLPAGTDAAAASFARAIVESYGTRTALVAARPGNAAALDGVTRALRWLQPLLAGSIEVLDAASSGLSLRTRDGAAPVLRVPPRLFFDNDSLSTLLFYDAPAAADPIAVSVTVPVEGTAKTEDLQSAAWQSADGYSRDGATVRLSAPRPGVPVLVDFNADASPEGFATRTGVTGVRQLTVEEVIANQRREQAREDAAVNHYSAHVRMSQHFRPTVTDPGYDVLTENRLFVAADGIEWEELSFSVNGSKFGDNRPPFPLLQPEKVLSLPLQLRLSDDYRYRLTGTEQVDGHDCYVVKFDPIDSSRSLYRGTVWIDRRSFTRIRLQTVQTRLSAPVVSSEEVQTFSPVSLKDGTSVYLMSHLVGRQIVMIAGRNLLVERDALITDVDVNDPAFEGSRTEARRSPHVMYRDTDRGLRYFVKQGDTRVVSDHPTTRAKAMAMGITLDPSFAFPLPIFGVNYLNFSFGSPDNQFAMLFGGVLAAINIQRPKVPHTPFDASVDFFGIAVPSSDRRYDSAGEHPSERVITWPITTGLNLGWQYTPFQKVTFQYQFRFDGYHADTTTAENFVVPSSTITNGLGGAYEYRRGGYSAVANGAWYGRGRWKPWGVPGSLEEPERTYTRVSANLSRDFYISPIQKIHLNGAWFGGSRLDRFSRYQFGLFDDTRIHGVPASGVRFDDLAMARGSYTFDILEMYRIDLFLERAWGRDLSASRDWQPITGIGAALNLRAPFNTILRMDVGHAWLSPEYRGIGSTVVQVLLLKPLGS